MLARIAWWAKWICLGALAQPVSHAGAEAGVGDARACQEAARAAEQAFSLPTGILAAIGKVESGNWPWAANIDGAGQSFRTKAEAVEALSRVRVPRPGNIDIGCFQ